MASQGQVELIVQEARQRGLDPYAVLAVARQEGLGGGIGDNGTSFGPFQLHVGGAFPGQVAGQSTSSWTTEQRQAWAWSADGIGYALDRIASVAKGQVGQSAVASIVYRFERPADPASETRNANSAYISLYRSTAGNPSGLASIIAAGGSGVSGVVSAVEGAAGKIVGAGRSAANVVPDPPFKSDVEGLFKGAKSVGEVLDKLNSLDFWLRAGQVAAGAVLILVGLVLLARQIALSFDVDIPTPPLPSGVGGG